jgi:1-acyl-sn-glycerol-3-phosphate acyltransferase
MLIRLVITITRIVIGLIANVETINIGILPKTGGVVVASNHLGRLDAIIGVLFANRDDLILMIAEKYQKYFLWRWLARQLNALWLNRFETDFHAMRQVYHRLRRGEMLAIAPEGTRSQTEALAPGKPGAAFLAAKAGVPMIPTAITGTEDREVKARLKRLKRLDIKIRFGQPFTLPPMPRKNRDVYLEEQTEEIMCQIAALLPAEYRGVYADHPRLRALLAERIPDPSS